MRAGRWDGTEIGDEWDKFNDCYSNEEGNVCSGVLLLGASVKQARKCRTGKNGEYQVK
jgi:hypothetical protein